MTFPNVTREGYTFLGWFTEEEYGDEVTEETKIMRSRTLWPRWQPPVSEFFRFYGELGWMYPLDHEDSRFISSGYNASRDSGGHVGIDIQRRGPNGLDTNVIIGDNVFAIHNGFVLISGDSPSAGFWVAIESDVIDPNTNLSIVSRYLHLRDRPMVSVGTIYRGEKIGYVGNTGQTFGSGLGGRSSGHLHLDFNNGGVFQSNSTIAPFTINPQRFFPNIDFMGATSNSMD